MGRRGSVMVREPEYGACEITDWVQSALYDYLCKKRLEVNSPNEECNTEDANHWEIHIDGSYDKKGRFNPDCAKLEKAIADLRGHPGRIKDGKTPMGEHIANMLEEGVTAVRKHGYFCLQIDWA